MPCGRRRAPRTGSAPPTCVRRSVAHQWDEAIPAQSVRRLAGGHPPQRPAGRHDHDADGRELIDEFRGDLGRHGRDEDAIEACQVRRTEHAAPAPAGRTAPDQATRARCRCARRPAPARPPGCRGCGTRSRPSTLPLAPTRCASSAVVQPEPEPTSSTRCPGRTSSSSSIRRTVEGWEFVWPWPIGSGASRAALRRCELGRKAVRGQAAQAASSRVTCPGLECRGSRPARPRTHRPLGADVSRRL